MTDPTANHQDQALAILARIGAAPDEAIDLFLPSNGRYASGTDMGEPLVLLCSKLSSFVSGVNLPVDFGYCAEIYMGQRDDLLGIGA